MISYFSKTERDEAFYETYLLPRLPRRILDAHAHFNLPEHLVNVGPERIASDWALQAGFQMSMEEAQVYVKALFPQQEYHFTGFGFPIAEADLQANNAYVAQLVKAKKLDFGLMMSHPQWDAKELRDQLRAGGFVGLKPYPDLISKSKGAEKSIFSFLPKSHIAAAYEMDKCILLHLPRAGRLADKDNVRELKEILREFPGIKLILAHLGRCFNPRYFEEAMVLLGEDIHKMWFDTAAVLNPKVHQLAFSSLAKERIFFGLDLPIFLWHGKRMWTEDTYSNLCREALPWKQNIEDEKAQSEYVFFVYEQLNNLLDTMEALYFSSDEKAGFFEGNARTFFERCTKGGKK